MSRSAARLAWYRLRATLSHRLGGYVVLVGLIGGIAMAAVAALALANLVAALPGRAAARTAPALLLRSE